MILCWIGWEKEKVLVISIISFSHSVFESLFCKGCENGELFNPLPDDKILDWSKLKQSADNNFEFDVNSRKFSKLVENTVAR